MPCTLSIIIVSYRSLPVLTITLHSAIEAVRSLDFSAEIIVVDNASGFDQKKLQEGFPSVKFTFLEKNIGFGAANNIGADLALGEMLLLLNPDTVVSSNAITLAVDVAKQPEIGGVGIQMIDAYGNFLPESKRKMPTFLSSLMRILKLDTLLSRFFPGFTYYFEDLAQDQSGEIEILAGAFIAIQKNKFKAIGGFDTDFFMYGEDIDFSHRLRLAGYKNYYIGNDSIIHFKGESASIHTFKYLYHFFHSLLIFFGKHFPRPEWGVAKYFALLVVWFAIGVGLIFRYLKIFLFPAIDFIGIYGLLYSFTLFWSHNLKGDQNYYPMAFYGWILPIYIFAIICFHWALGIYSKGSSAQKLIRSTFLSSLFLYLVYNFLPENFRYSRAILVMGSVGSFIVPLLSHLVLMGKNTFFLNKKFQNSFYIGSENSREKALELLLAIFPYNVIVLKSPKKYTNILFDIQQPFSSSALQLAKNKKAFSFFSTSLNCIIIPQKSSLPSIAYGYWDGFAFSVLSLFLHRFIHILFGWISWCFFPFSKISFSDWCKICTGRLLFFGPKHKKTLKLPLGIFDIQDLSIQSGIKPWNFYFDYTFSNDIKLIFNCIFRA